MGIKKIFFRQPILLISNVSVNRCAWFWCIYALEGNERIILRRLPIKVFSYQEAIDIAESHLGLPFTQVRK